MSSCDNSNIKQNYIVTNTNEFETLTACTGIWTSNIYGCSPITVRDQLKLNSVSNNNTLNRILVIDNLTGLVQYRNINSIISGASGISDFTYDNENTFTITDTSGNILSSTIDVMSGLTINGVLSATTYQGLPLDIYVTGGTYFDGDLTLTNNSGGTFNIGGFYTGQTNYVNSLTTGVGLSANTTTGNISIINTDPDQIVVLNDGSNISVTGTYPNFTIDVTGLTDNNTYTTGFTYQDNTFTISDTSGNTLSTTIDVMTGLTINGNLIANNISGTNNYIPKFTPNSYSIGNSIITNNSNNVSIGTISTPYRFYVLGNNTTSGQPLFVVRDTGRIGIRTTSPLAELSIENSNPSISQDIMTLRNNGTGIGTGNSIRFINSTNSSSTVGSKIESTITNLSGRNVIKFFVHGGGGSFGGLQERMSLDGTGSLFVNNLNANIISGNTYLNLPLGVYTTGFTYQDNTFTISDTSGNTLSTTIDVMTGLTINGNLSATTISGGTLYGDGSNLTGLLSGLNVGVTQITNGTSGRVLFQSGTTLQQNSNLFWDNANGRLSIGQGSSPQAKFHVANTDKTVRTGLFSGSGQNILSVVGSGSTQPLFTVQGSSGELFSVTDSLIGTLFSVNDISGLPVLEVFSDNTILMGSYQSPSLNTTLKKTITAGLTTLYSIPLSAYTGGFFDYTLIGSGARSGTIMSIFSGSTVNYSESTTSDIGNTNQVTFNMNISGNSANLNVSATTGNWVIKTIVRGI